MAPINLPDGSQVSEIVLPDGSTASEVLAPDGSTVFRGIPDSLINQYLSTDFTTSKWSDSEGSLDLTTISGLQFDGTAFDGSGGVKSPNGGDYAQDGTFTFLENNYYSEWAVAFGFTSTDNGGYLWGINSDNTGFDDFIQCGIGGDASSNRLGISRRFGSTNNNIVESSVDVNDGGDYVAIIQSTGPTGGDLEMYFEPSVDSGAINQFGTDGDRSQSFNSKEMTYYARNDQGQIDSGMVALMTDIRWFNTSLTQSERSAVFDRYSWYNPSTDAP